MFPVAASLLDPAALAERVITPYGLGAIASCRLHTRGLNDTYRVEAVSGARYFLRVYRAGWRNAAQIAAELEALRHLASRGVAVAAALAHPDGADATALSCPEGERYAVLFAAAPGREVAWSAFTPEHAEAYGREAAAIHAATDGVADAGARDRLDLGYLLEQPLARIRAAFGHRPDDLREIETLAARLRDDIGAMKALEWGFCHGDFHGQNANFADGRFTVYDFDCAGWGWRGYDIAVFPWGFAIERTPPERLDALAAAFLRGYQAVRRLGAAERAAIPAFGAVRQIWLIGIHLGLGDRFGWGWMDDGYFDRQLAVLRGWRDRFLDAEPPAWVTSS